MKNMMEINGYRALIRKRKELRAEGRCLKCTVAPFTAPARGVNMAIFMARR